MTNLEFITKAFYGTTSKHFHNSLMADNEGNVYSYGYHYPLLFRAIDDVNDKLAFINNTGYSNTTSKHIGNAGVAARSETRIYIKLNGLKIHWEPFTLKKALELLRQERDGINNIMATKKRKDTRVYAMLQRDLDNVLYNIKLVKEVTNER